MPLEKLFFIFLEKTKKRWNGKSEKKKMQGLFGKNKETKKYFQNVKTTCIKVYIT